MLVIANGPGYTVSPTEGRAAFTIRDNDICTNPAATPGGVVRSGSPQPATLSVIHRRNRCRHPDPVMVL